jgi:hypothetical protein
MNLNCPYRVHTYYNNMQYCHYYNIHYCVRDGSNTCCYPHPTVCWHLWILFSERCEVWTRVFKRINLSFSMSVTDCRSFVLCLLVWREITALNNFPFSYAQPACLPSCVCEYINAVPASRLITTFPIPSSDRCVLATGQGSTNRRAGRLQDVTAHGADAADRGMINSTHPVNN